MNTTRIRITDLGGIATVNSYVANSEADCQDDTDRSAYREAVRLQDVITMGKVIAEPLPARPRRMHDADFGYDKPRANETWIDDSGRAHSGPEPGLETPAPDGADAEEWMRLSDRHGVE